VRPVEIFQAIHPGEGQVTRLQVLPGLELGVLVVFAEIAFDAAVGERLQLRAAVDRFDVAKIIAQHSEQLFHVGQAEVTHQHPVHLGSAFVLDWNTVVAAAFKGAEDTLA